MSEGKLCWVNTHTYIWTHVVLNERKMFIQRNLIILLFHFSLTSIYLSKNYNVNIQQLFHSSLSTLFFRCKKKTKRKIIRRKRRVFSLWNEMSLKIIFIKKLKMAAESFKWIDSWALWISLIQFLHYVTFYKNNS